MKKQGNILDSILTNRTAAHLLFWVTIVVSATSGAASTDGMWKIHTINNLSLLPVQVGAAYTLAYWQIPKLLFRKKYLLFLLSLVFFCFLFSALARLSVIYISEPLWRENFEQETVLEVLTDVDYLMTTYLPTAFIAPCIFLGVKTVKEYFGQRHRLEVLEKEKATAELKFLKAQIHPHFLFNTLNNLYALTLEKSDAAPEVVIKLSEMLDYMLYQGSESRVPLHKETDLIQNYIDLELLRYGERIDLTFDKEIENEQVSIAPLLLLSVVENAFKHGAGNNPEKPYIHITLRASEQHIYFRVFNTKPQVPSSARENKSKGVGKVNLEKQLNLIYPNQHRLKIEENHEHYILTLDLDL